MKLPLVLATAIAALAAHDATAKCAMQELVARLLTTPGATIPAGGGVLVGTASHSPDDYGRASRDDDPALTVTWKFQADGKPVQVDKVPLAPGLVVYRPKATASTLDVLDAKGGKLGAFKRDAAAPAVTSVVAPRVTKLETVTTNPGRGFRRTTTATVADPIPTDAFAVIVFTTDKTPKPISYGLVGRTDPKQRTVIAFADPGRCSFPPKGTMVPPTGTQVTLAWVDAYGRVSKQSAPIKVTEVPFKRDPSMED